LPSEVFEVPESGRVLVELAASSLGISCSRSDVTYKKKVLVPDGPRNIGLVVETATSAATT
jgi:hypothetical protein